MLVEPERVECERELASYDGCYQDGFGRSTMYKIKLWLSRTKGA